jgi:hypothetical protein
LVLASDVYDDHVEAEAFAELQVDELQVELLQVDELQVELLQVDELQVDAGSLV